MKLKIYQIDAFTDTVFKGNPAAVCPLNEWIADEKLLKIAAENNTAFLYGSNFSLGVNLFFALNEKLADLMKNSYATKTLLILPDERIGKPEHSLRNWL